MKLYMKYITYCTADYCNCVRKPEIQDFNEVLTRDLAIPVRCSNQLSYEVTDVGGWSFVGSNEPVRNEYYT